MRSTPWPTLPIYFFSGDFWKDIDVFLILKWYLDFFGNYLPKIIPNLILFLAARTHDCAAAVLPWRACDACCPSVPYKATAPSPSPPCCHHLAPVLSLALYRSRSSAAANSRAHGAVDMLSEHVHPMVEPQPSLFNWIFTNRAVPSYVCHRWVCHHVRRSSFFLFCIPNTSSCFLALLTCSRCYVRLLLRPTASETPSQGSQPRRPCSLHPILLSEPVEQAGHVVKKFWSLQAEQNNQSTDAELLCTKESNKRMPCKYDFTVMSCLYAVSILANRIFSFQHIIYFIHESVSYENQDSTETMKTNHRMPIWKLEKEVSVF